MSNKLWSNFQSLQPYTHQVISSLSHDGGKKITAIMLFPKKSQATLNFFSLFEFISFKSYISSFDAPDVKPVTTEKKKMKSS